MLAAVSVIIGVGALVLPQVGIDLIPGAQVTTEGTYAGPITPRMAHQDVLSASTTFNEGSNVQTKWLRCTGCVGVPSSGYQLMTTGNSTFSSIEVSNCCLLYTSDAADE